MTAPNLSPAGADVLSADALFTDALPADTLIEIDDPEIDPAAIMAEIRRRIVARRRELGYDQRAFPSYGAAIYQGEPADIPFDPDLHYFLRLANATFAEAETEPVLADSPALRVPVLGRLWGMIRGGAHNLVLFYVNRAVTHQTSVNGYFVSALNRLTAVVEDQQRTIQRRQAELEAERRRKGEE